MKIVKTKPIVWKSILATILGLVAYLVVGILVTGVLALAAGFLLAIPVVGNILAWLLTRGDGEPTTLLVFASAAASAASAMKLVEKICKHDRTAGLACKILGVGLIATQAYFLFSNLFMDGGGFVLSNIISIGAGCIIFGCGKEALQPDLAEDEPEPEEPQRVRNQPSPHWHPVVEGMMYTRPTDRYIHIKDLQYAADYFGVDIDTALQILNEDRQSNGYPPFEVLKV